MMLKKKRTTLLYEQKCAEIESSGARLQPSDYIWLGELCDAACADDEKRHIVRPLCINGVQFWPLSIAALRWLNEYAGQYFTGASEELVAIGFASYHSRDENNVFERLVTFHAAAVAILAWKMRVGHRITLDELRALADHLIGAGGDEIDVGGPEDRFDGGELDWGAFVASVAVAAGCAPRHAAQLTVDEASALLSAARRADPRCAAVESDRSSDAFGRLLLAVKWLKEHRRADVAPVAPDGDGGGI